MNSDDQPKQEDVPPVRRFMNVISEFVQEVQKHPIHNIPEGSPTYEKRTIRWGNRTCEIEKDTNMDFVCRYFFKLPVGSRASWDEIYEEMEGLQGQIIDSKNERKIYDAIEGVNRKTVTCFSTPIFKWENKGASRIF